MNEQIIDMHRAAKIIGAYRTSAEKFLAAQGVLPVGQVLNRTGHTRYYDIEAVKKAAKEWPAYLKRMHQEKAEKMNMSKYGRHTRKKQQPAIVTSGQTPKHLILSVDPDFMDALERLCNSLNEVMGKLEHGKASGEA